MGPDDQHGSSILLGMSMSAESTLPRAPAMPAPVGVGLGHDDEDSDAKAETEEAMYVVADCKVRSGGRVARLHLRKGCYLGRTLAFASYQLLYIDPPPARSYTDFCRRCWPSGAPKENVAELTSDSDGETTSSNGDDGAERIMSESLKEMSG